MKNKLYLFSVAPMMDKTDRHCRYFYRKLSRQALLYTEMITTNAIIHSKKDFLIYNKEEHPLVLQLGGNNPKDLAYCAKLAEQRGYDELNFNVGCPSQRVQNGFFGAYLMNKAHLVADIVKAMRDVVSIPVTIKTRIGINDQDSYDFLYNFIDIVSRQGECNNFIIHARKALLTGFSPKENRDIPLLDYTPVYQIKKDFSHINIIINGGIKTIEQVKIHLQYVDGVMIGREVYQNPSILANIDRELFKSTTGVPNNIEVVRSLYPYIERELSKGTYLNHITRHIMNLFHGANGARHWRRHLSENAHKLESGVKILEEALRFIN
ncbi:tRNA-dihydrouridine(20/20a) synthase [Candidatus Profftia lariciata]|uniref:tRNA dihydrouridine(20/20a) synthase DusA n=1 Tax=Candidatus Profftia lariciata TaxID=1987921 RepID=UPI001D0167B7|nr:tRNA dihydrouridine(20/20a) synthase DusA [Candidatus Profftia lariciata]UDG81667.1 tRNA-dihydrouridine(20/20a) synthase [Candidatus Profftia lariciata]